MGDQRGGQRARRRDIVRHIVGKELDNLFARRPQLVARPDKPPRFAVQQLADDKLQRISFEVYHGEVVGIAGLGGSGRTRLLHLLFGAARPSQGEILIDGRPHRFEHPGQALAAGVALVTEDRQHDGFVGNLPIWQNVTLPWLQRFQRLGVLRRGQEWTTAQGAARRLGVKMPSLSALMTELSGGNQQKVILGRWICGQLRVLLLDEPTHGVDVRSKKEIHDIIRHLAADGVAVVVVSSEFEELEALCDRVLLLREGEVIGEMRERQVSKDAILHVLLADAREARA